MSSLSAAAEQPEIPMTGLVAPLEGKPGYPFTRNESVYCGQWGENSQDYPYFGAPRDQGRRRHAGVDVYPEGGTGSSVKALADGIIIKIAPFYTRANGEVTYGVLVDHADFVANYAELNKPDSKMSTSVKQGQTIGTISGTKQLHFELYTKGTKDWLRWYGKQPDDLMDPTQILIKLFDN
ncbi:MAG: M23 family metallopeptidase [Verrucomicrobia bacterium]|nr:M23 family metallopeptidase [Deltaproteobacteria bacterium]